MTTLDAPTAGDEATRHEHQLRRAADARATEVGDPALATILGHVRDRRRRRAPGPMAGSGVGRPLASPRPVDAAGAAGTEPGSPPPASNGPAGQILAVEVVSADVRIFRVGRPAGLTFRAGQYLKVGAPGRRRGSFSIASSPHDPHLELCIERIPDGRLTPALFVLGAGDRLDVGDRVKGSFGWDDAAAHHLMVGTKTGIAPLRSMLRDALHRGLPGEITVVHGASHVDELPYRAELEALAAAHQRLTYLPTVSRPAAGGAAGWLGRTGRADPLALESARRLAPDRTRVYLCGNTGMIDHLSSELGARGFPVSTEAYD